MDNKKPKLLHIRKIVWTIAVVVGFILFILGLICRGICSDIFLTFGLTLLIMSGIFVKFVFEAEFEKLRLEKELYIQKQTGELKEEYLDKNAEISHKATKKTFNSIRQGLTVEKYPKCGDKIEANEEFCSNCGTNIYLKCPKCNTKNQAGDNFCRKCGTKLKEQ